MARTGEPEAQHIPPGRSLRSVQVLAKAVRTVPVEDLQHGTSGCGLEPVLKPLKLEV